MQEHRSCETGTSIDIPRQCLSVNCRRQKPTEASLQLLQRQRVSAFLHLLVEKCCWLNHRCRFRCRARGDLPPLSARGIIRHLPVPGFAV